MRQCMELVPGEIPTLLIWPRIWRKVTSDACGVGTEKKLPKLSLRRIQKFLQRAPWTGREISFWDSG